MKSEGKFLNTDYIELFLSVSMPLADWKRIRKSLESATWTTVGANFRAHITSLIDKAEAQIEPSITQHD